MYAVAGGRGFFIWVLFRSLTHTVGWPVTIAILVVVAVAGTYAKQRRER